MALIICSECGKEYSDRATACPNCGCPTRQTEPRPQSDASHTIRENQYSQSYSTDVEGYARKLAAKEQTSGIIWIAISIVQLILGIFGAWLVLIVGIINMITAIKSFKKAKLVLTPYQGMVDEYDKQLIPLIIALAYNLIIGGVIGVIGNIYDMVTRNFVLENRNIFVKAAEDNAAQQVETQAPAVSGTRTIDPDNYSGNTKIAASWTCSCGRVNANYVTSCVCGESKYKK